MPHRLGRRKLACQKHIQTRHCNTLTPCISLSRVRFLVLPLIASTGIQKHRNNEKINQSASLFFSVVAFVLPLAVQVVDSWDAADVEVLPAAMGRNGFKVVGTKISLLWLLADVGVTVQVKSMFSYEGQILGTVTKTIRLRIAMTHVDHRSHISSSLRQLVGMIDEMRKLIFLSSSKDNLSSFTDSLERQQVFNVRCHGCETGSSMRRNGQCG